MPSRVVEGDRSDDFPSALIAALLAKSPLELLSIEESLFLTCLRGLSRKVLEGDLDGVMDGLSDSGTGARAGLETEIAFLGLSDSRPA